jgi:hypothetical protein
MDAASTVSPKRKGKAEEASLQAKSQIRLLHMQVGPHSPLFWPLHDSVRVELLFLALLPAKIRCFKPYNILRDYREFYN